MRKANQLIFRPAPVWCIVLAFIAFTEIAPESARAHESSKKGAETQKMVESLLERVDLGRFKNEEETKGFRFLFSSRFTSPFDYRIYGSSISSANPAFFLRIEGSTGDVLIFERILSEEKFFLTADTRTDRAVALSGKSHIIAQTLNLAAPWISTLYSSYNSPRLTTAQTTRRFFGFLFLDLFVGYAAGSNFFRERFDATKYRGNIAAGLGFIRVMTILPQINLIRGHNRLAELKYTFYLD